MKKYVIVKSEEVTWNLSAQEMRIEGGATIFTNAQEGELKWNVLVIPLHSLDRISEYADD